MNSITMALVLCVLALATCACETYSSRALPPQADLDEALPTHDASPLDMDAVATIAVLNNADLNAVRAKTRVVEAQAFAAGLLPDPQFSGSIDHPTQSGKGYVDAYNLGLSIDLQALLTRSDKSAAANATLDQARLENLWQEWQTVAQARNLYVQRVIGLQRVQFLDDAQATYVAQSERTERAVRNGDVTLEQSGGDVALLGDLRVQLGASQRNAAQSDHALRALLNLAPRMSLPLQPVGVPQIPSREEVEHAVAVVAQTRPDLLALQAGYEAQEKQLHKAVLAQFPNIAIGFTKARDTSDVRTVGLGVALTLPLFDRGRGEIAVQSATREQLHTEYRARLDQAVADVWRLWDDMQQLQLQITQLEVSMPERQAALDNARRAYEARDLTAASYMTLLGSVLNGATALFDLRQALWGDAIALATVLGTQIEPVGAKKQDTNT